MVQEARKPRKVVLKTVRVTAAQVRVRQMLTIVLIVTRMRWRSHLEFSLPKVSFNW